MPARSGRPLDVFDWGHGGAVDGRDTGQRQKGSQYSKSTLSLATAGSVKKVLNMMRLAQSWIQWGDFPPQGPLPCVSGCCLVNISNLYLERDFCNQEEQRQNSWGITRLTGEESFCHHQVKGLADWRLAGEKCLLIKG